MAVKSRPFSYLNPNAPLFIPAAFLQAEDFSPEWWLLVHTSPAFRDYWLRDRYDCTTDSEDISPDDLDELDAVDDLLDLHADLAEMDLVEEAFRFSSSDSPADCIWSVNGKIVAVLNSFPLHLASRLWEMSAAFEHPSE